MQANKTVCLFDSLSLLGFLIFSISFVSFSLYSSFTVTDIASLLLVKNIHNYAAIHIGSLFTITSIILCILRSPRDIVYRDRIGGENSKTKRT